MKKKVISIISLLLSLILVFATASADLTDPNANEPGTYPVCKEPITLKVGVKQSENVIDYETNGYTLMCEKDAGVDIEIVPFPGTDDAESKLKLMINSNQTKLPDILTFGVNNDSDRFQYGKSGALLALDEYFDRETGLAKAYYDACEKAGFDADELLSLVRSPDGHIYGVPTFQPGLSNRYSNRAYINKTWLSNLGLDVPNTIDELTEVLIAFRDEDPNGNGIKDEIPLSGANYTLTNNSNILNWLQNMFIYNDCTANRFLPVKDGRLDVSYDKEEYREFLKYVNMLVSEGLLDKACFTQSLNELRAQLKAETETVGMMCGSASGFGDNIASWEPITQPIGLYGERTVTTYFSDFNVSQAITTDCENPEIAFLFLMMGYSSDVYAKSARYGILGEDWEYPDDDMKSVFFEIGVKPTVKEIHNIWGVVQNSHWAGASVLPCALNGGSDVYKGEIHNERYHARSVMMNMQYAPDYSTILKKLVYTPEEADEWADLRSSLQTFVLESTAKFAVGTLDPNSDADWNAYLNELNTLRYKEILELDNEVYSRMNSK